jgi:hypothetical protein
MDAFSYLPVLTSIVLALGITRLLPALRMPDPFEEGFDSKQHFYDNHPLVFQPRRPLVFITINLRLLVWPATRQRSPSTG